MMTGYYLTVLKSDPTYDLIVSECESEHKKNAPGCLLSICEMKSEEVLIKIAKGNDTWLNKLDWKTAVIQKFKSDESVARLAYYDFKKPIDDKVILDEIIKEP